MTGTSWKPTAEYLAARRKAIERIVAEAPRPTAGQIETLRRIFASARRPEQQKGPGHPEG